MYLIIILLILALGGWLIAKSLKTEQQSLYYGGIALIVSMVLFFAGMSLWGEVLWFENLNFASRIWTEIGTRVGLAMIGGVIGGVGSYLLLVRSPFKSPLTRPSLVTLATILGILWGIANWQLVLLFTNQQPTGIIDPIIGADTGFYLFTLPFWDQIIKFLCWLCLVGMSINGYLVFSPKKVKVTFNRRASRLTLIESEDTIQLRPLILPAGLSCLVLADLAYLGSYHLLYSNWGVVLGPGWTDVHIRMPGLYITAIASLVCGLVLIGLDLLPKVKDWLQ